MAYKYKKASNALKAAKKLISNSKHWTQEDWAVTYRDGHRRRCSPKSPHAEAFCALGAVKRVNGPAEKSATAFLQQAAETITGCHRVLRNNNNIFTINDTKGHEATMEMFTRAIKAALAAGK